MSDNSLKEEKDSALVFAAADGDARKVEELLSQGGRVDAREQGFTPLLAAAQGGHTEVCKLLLETGKANVKETKHCIVQHAMAIQGRWRSCCHREGGWTLETRRVSHLC